MYANPGFQRIKLVEASAFLDLDSTPLMIKFNSIDNDSYGEVCFHLENKPLAEALVKAINDVLADPSLVRAADFVSVDAPLNDSAKIPDDVVLIAPQPLDDIVF